MIGVRALADDLRGAASAITRSGLLRPVVPRPSLLRVGLSASLGTPSVATAVAYQAATRPGALAVIDDRGELTWRELRDRSDRLAAVLDERAPADGRLAFLVGNGREALECYVGAARAGLGAVPLNTSSSADDLAHVAQTQQPAVVVVDPEHAAAAEAAFGADRLLVTGEPYEEALRAARPIVGLRGGSALIVTHTSGTTGRPKGAERDLSLDAVAAFVGFLERVPLHRDDRLCIPAPLFHAFAQGVLGVSVVLGSTLVLPRRFDAGALLATIAARDITAVALVPVMLRRLLEVPDAPPTPSWQIGILSGSAFPAELRERAEARFGRIFHDLYGSTEVGWTAIATPEELRERPGTVGRPGRGVHVEVVDDDGRPLPVGEVGRILVRSGMAFRGYTGAAEPAEAPPAIDTGDLGRLDADGYLYVTGRADDMIVSGGENIYPSEVEAVLDRHPDLAEAVVCGVPDEEFGQVLHAHVVPRPGIEVSPEDVVAHARAHLPRFKVPKRVLVREELPRNAAGKVVKADL